MKRKGRKGSGRVKHASRFALTDEWSQKITNLMKNAGYAVCEEAKLLSLFPTQGSFLMLDSDAGPLELETLNARQKRLAQYLSEMRNSRT